MLAQHMFGPERHRRLAELLDIQPESRVVDLGCGPGHTLVEIALRLGAAGSLVGVDTNIQKAETEMGNDPRIALIVADLCEPLPFADESFDRVLCHNVLELLPDPDAFLVEVARILCGGGRFVLGHSDFDTIVFNSDNLEFTRQLVHLFCDTTQAWMKRSDGTMGRKLSGVVGRSPLKIEQVAGWVGIHTSFDPRSPGRYAAEEIARVARRYGGISCARVDRWLAGLERLAKRGEFFYSLNDYAVVASKR